MLCRFPDEKLDSTEACRGPNRQRIKKRAHGAVVRDSDLSSRRPSLQDSRPDEAKTGKQRIRRRGKPTRPVAEDAGRRLDQVDQGPRLAKRRARRSAIRRAPARAAPRISHTAELTAISRTTRPGDDGDLAPQASPQAASFVKNPGSAVRHLGPASPNLSIYLLSTLIFLLLPFSFVHSIFT